MALAYIKVNEQVKVSSANEDCSDLSSEEWNGCNGKLMYCLRRKLFENCEGVFCKRLRWKMEVVLGWL